MYVGCKEKMMSEMNRGNWNHPAITQTIPEKHNGKAQHHGTTNNNHIVHCTHSSVSKKVKVQQSHYRPAVAQRILRKLRFPDFMTTAQDGGRFSALCTGRLYPRETLLVLFC